MIDTSIITSTIVGLFGLVILVLGFSVIVQAIKKR